MLLFAYRSADEKLAPDDFAVSVTLFARTSTRRPTRRPTTQH